MAVYLHMTDDNLVLEQLRTIRAAVGEIKTTQSEHGERLNRIEQGIAGVRRDQAYDAENAAHQSSRLDRLAERIARIERRLELADD